MNLAGSQRSVLPVAALLRLVERVTQESAGEFAETVMIFQHLQIDHALHQFRSVSQ